MSGINTKDQEIFSTSDSDIDFSKTTPCFVRPLYGDICQNKALVGSRGLHKTSESIGYGLSLLELLPRKNILYCCHTLTNAIEYTRQPLNHFIQYCTKYKICKVRPAYSNHRILFQFPNGDERALIFGSYSQAETLRGGHPYMGIFDEASYISHSLYYEVINGLQSKENLFIGTAKQGSLFHELFVGQQNNPNWKLYKLKASTSGVFSKEYLEEKRRLLPPNVFEAEYECNFDVSLDGTFVYAQIILDKKKAGVSISNDIGYDKTLPVYTSWDIGWNDYTVVWFFQVNKQNKVRFIDYYEDHQIDMDIHFMKVQNMGYEISKSFFPHDASYMQFSSRVSGIKGAARFKLNPVLIERTKSVYGEKIPESRYGWNGVIGTYGLIIEADFSASKCEAGLKHLMLYKMQEDRNTNEMIPKPVLRSPHNHAADAIRMALESEKHWVNKTNSTPKVNYVHSGSLLEYELDLSY